MAPQEGPDIGEIFEDGKHCIHLMDIEGIDALFRELEASDTIVPSAMNAERGGWGEVCRKAHRALVGCNPEDRGELAQLLNVELPRAWEEDRLRIKNLVQQVRGDDNFDEAWGLEQGGGIVVDDDEG